MVNSSIETSPLQTAGLEACQLFEDQRERVSCYRGGRSCIFLQRIRFIWVSHAVGGSNPPDPRRNREGRKLVPPFTHRGHRHCLCHEGINSTVIFCKERGSQAENVTLHQIELGGGRAKKLQLARGPLENEHYSPPSACQASFNKSDTSPCGRSRISRSMSRRICTTF
jgi:hypothetical protein